MNKNRWALLVVFLLGGAVWAQAQDVLLPKPQMTGGKPLMEALAQRHSARRYDTQKTLSQQQMANLLWAACGVNRADGRRTSPTAINAQEIDVYVFTKEGVYLYLAKENKLKEVMKGDQRAQTTTQESAQECPLILVYVGALDRFGRMDEANRQFYSATDCGFVSQNVYLYCASEGLSTVVLGYVNRDIVHQLLNLSASHKVLLAQPVGYAK